MCFRSLRELLRLTIFYEKKLPGNGVALEGPNCMFIAYVELFSLEIVPNDRVS